MGYTVSPKKNPRGPSKGNYHVFRGGGWHSGAICNNVYYRTALKAAWLDFNVGYCCVKDK